MTLSEIAAALEGTFAGEQLEQASQAFLSAEEWSRAPAALLILSTVCGELAEIWDRPVTGAESEALRTKYLSAIVNLAEAIRAADSVRERELMNTLAQLLRSD